MSGMRFTNEALPPAHLLDRRMRVAERRVGSDELPGSHEGRARATAALHAQPPSPRAGTDQETTMTDDFAKILRNELGAAALRPGASAGERFVSSGRWRAWASDARGGAGPWRPARWSMRVLETDELRSALRFGAITGLINLEVPAPLPPRLRPVRPRVSSLVTTIPVRSRLIDHRTQTARTPAAGGRPPGVLLPEGVATFTKVQLSLIRFGVATPVSEAQFVDPGQARQAVESVIADDWRYGLERQILSGSGVKDGSTESMLGITATPGVTSIARVAEPRQETLAQAVAAVQNAEHGGDGVTVAVNPTDYFELRTAKDTSAAFLALNLEEVTWVPTPGLAVGTAVVGDFSRYHVYIGPEGLEVDASSEHASNFLDGNVTLRAQAFVEGRVADLTAFVIVTNL